MSNPSVKNDPAGPRSEPRPRARRVRRRLNLRAVLILAVLAVVAVPGFFALKSYQDHHGRSALLAEARELLDHKPPKPNEALNYLNRYLELNPGDDDALDLKGKVLFDLARSTDQAFAAMAPTEQVVRDDNLPVKDGKPYGKLKRPEARRRLVRLNLAVGRLQTANTLAGVLVDSEARTAEDYRLLGRTFLALGAGGAETILGPEDPVTKKPTEVDAWERAIANYEKAQELEPGNVEGARNLAYLYQSRRQDGAKATGVLDRLLGAAKTDAEKAAARVARYEHFAASAAPGEPDRSLAELAEAVKLSPDDPDILLLAAVDALRRGDVEGARGRIESIPRDKLSNPTTNVRTLSVLGELDARDNKIDDAIKDWRQGLVATGGVSEALTWRLAFVLLRLGRADEARSLVDQYHRLTDKPTGPIPKAVFLDALLKLKTGDPGKAIEELDKIRLTTAADKGGKGGVGDEQSLGAEVAYTLAQAYEAKGEDAKALDAYRQAAKIVRTTKGLRWADPWIAAANGLMRSARLAEAAAELEDGLVAMPGDAGLLINLGRVRFMQAAREPKEKRSFAEFEKVLAAALRAAPGSADLVKLQVPYLEANGRLDKAADLLAAATDPKHRATNPELWALYAEVLRRLNRKEQALEVLDRVPPAVGEQAVLRMERAQVLVSLGREKAAYDTLAEGAKLVPAAQRPAVLKAMGDLHRKLNDPSAARKSYAEWARLAPKDPQPHLMNLELALAADDGRAVREEVAALEAIGGIARSLARALVLLRPAPGEDKDARAGRLDQAEAVIKAVIDADPAKPIGYLLQGRLLEQRGKVDDALKAYRTAREKNGGQDALRDLFVLLTRQKRFDELRRLRAELRTGELTPELEQIAAGIALATGSKDEAFQMMQQVVRGDPQGLDTRLWQVGVLNALGKPEEAEKILQGLIQQRPEALDPRVALMMLQIGQKQRQKAAETVEQIRAQVKTERPEFVWAGCYAALGDLAKAGEFYRASLRKWPDDQDVRQRAVAFFRASGRPEEAEAALRDVLKAEPTHAWARRELAQVLSARRDDPAAWAEALKLVGEAPADADTAEDRLVRATVLARAGDPARRAEAIGVLEGLVKDSPGAVANMAHELMARIYADANDSAKALEHAERVAARGNDPNAIAFYAELLIRARHLDEAGKQVDRLAQLEPDSPRVLGLHASVLHAEGRTQEAAKELVATFEARKKLPDGEPLGRKILELLGNLGQADAAEQVGRSLADEWPRSAWAAAPTLARRGRLDEALKLCRRAADAGNGADAGSVAAALVASQPPGADAAARLDQAEAIVDAGLKQQPKSPSLRFARASLQRLRGRYADAAASYAELLAQDPANSLVLNNLAWTLSEDLGRPAEGLEKIDAALRQAGRVPSLLDTRGVILTRLGRLDEAIRELEGVAKAAPAAPAFYHLARAYHKAGRADEFRKALDRAKQAGLAPASLDPDERAEMQALLKS